MRILIVFIIVIWFYSLQRKIYLRNCFNEVSTHVKFAKDGIFEGEATELTEEILNKKLIPLWWVTAKFQVSKNIIFTEEISGNNENRQDFFSIMSYEKVTKTFKIMGSKRGLYSIKQIDLHSGDLFGENKIIYSSKNKADLYVYPRLISPQELNVNFRSLTGDILTKRNIVEDPFQLRGVREYNSFDSIKDVNWTATAKTGELKVNEYDFTASQEVIIFLDLERYNNRDSEELIEESIRLTASIITQYLKQGIKVGLNVNGYDLITGKQIKVPCVSGINQNLHFYERLAVLDTKKISVPTNALLVEERMKQNKAPLWIVVSHYFGNELQDEINISRHQGFDVKWILLKSTKTKVEIEDYKDLFVWEVKVS